MDFNNIFALSEANEAVTAQAAPQIADPNGNNSDALSIANAQLKNVIKTFEADAKIKEIEFACDGAEATTKKGTFGHYKNNFLKSSRNMFKIVIITLAIAALVTVGVAGGMALYKKENAKIDAEEKQGETPTTGGAAPNDGTTPNANGTTSTPGADNTASTTVDGEGNNTEGNVSVDNNQTNKDDVQNLPVTCENSIEAQAKAKPGDVIQRKDGTKVKLTQGDINWAQQQLNKGAAPTAPANPVTQTGTGTNPKGTATVTPETAPETTPTPTAPENNATPAPTQTATTVDNGANDAGFQRWKNQNSKNYQSMVAQAQASGQSDPEAAAYKMYKQGLASNDVNAFRAAQNANGMVDASGSGRTDGKAIRTMQKANLQQYNAQQIDNLANTDADFAKYIQFYKQEHPKMANATNEEIVKKVTGFGGTSGLYQTVTDPNGETTQVIPDEYKPMKAALDRAKALYKNKTVS